MIQALWKGATEGLRCSYKQYGHYILTRKASLVPIGQLKVSRNGRSYTYHRLLESVRTAKGPRQRLVLSLGTLDLPKQCSGEMRRR